MTGILALETATEACSVAIAVGDGVCERHEVVPRQHSQRLFSMLRELLPGGELRSAGIEAVAYGSGPGSFTGLRIAASAAQGLAYACALPAVPVSTLATQAQAALHQGLAQADALVLSTVDARIDEVYAALYGFRAGLAELLEGPWVLPPAALAPERDGPLLAVGSGCRYLEAFPARLRSRLHHADATLLPSARDMLPLAREVFRRGEIQAPQAVSPVYVRDEISWKKIPQQGKPA